MGAGPQHRTRRRGPPLSLETFVLSELYSGNITYGRELQRRFEAASITSWDSVCPSSVYRAIARLEKAGFVARFRPAARAGHGAGRQTRNKGKEARPGSAGREQAGTRGRAGPRAGAALRNRKFYAITARGRRRFEALLGWELVEPRTYRNPLNIAVHCVRALPSPRAVSLLEERKRRLSVHEARAQAAARRALTGGREAGYERMAAERILVKTRAELFFAGSLAEYLAGAG